MYRPGPKNLITDVTGLWVGHATDEGAQSGVTVLTSHMDWAASVDVRGGGPGTRETDALAPENLIGRAHAVVLSGGSVFGLAAADGVAAALSAAGTGLKLRPGSPSIPLVPAAVLHDLGNGGDKQWGMDPPYRKLGVTALGNAAADFSLGSVGAGRGAMAGLAKGGIGSASIDIGIDTGTGDATATDTSTDTGIIVGALVAVNSIGSVFMPDGKTYWAWPFELDDEFGGAPPPVRSGAISDPAPDDSRLLSLGRLAAGANTTLGVIACNADLTSVECKRIAMMAQDGIARAVRPAHTPFDGDTIFALASGAVALEAGGRRPVQIARIGSAAADCLARAIARAVYASRAGHQHVSAATPISGV
jgi:L-aminopeptidase/D-esterase-like protein